MNILLFGVLGLDFSIKAIRDFSSILSIIKKEKENNPKLENIDFNIYKNEIENKLKKINKYSINELFKLEEREKKNKDMLISYLTKNNISYEEICQISFFDYLWNIKKEEKNGFHIRLDKIPFNYIINEIENILNVNNYKVNENNIIIVKSICSEKILYELGSININGQVIGYTLDEKKYLISNRDGIKDLYR